MLTFEKSINLIKNEENISKISKFFEEPRNLSINDIIKYFLDFDDFKKSWRFTKFADQDYKQHFLDLKKILNEDELRVYVYFFQHLISLRAHPEGYRFSVVKREFKLFKDIYVFNEN